MYSWCLLSLTNLTKVNSIGYVFGLDVESLDVDDSNVCATSHVHKVGKIAGIRPALISPRHLIIPVNNITSVFCS